MNVLLVSAEFPPQTAGGGIGTQALAKARRLAEAGHGVHVLSHSVDGAVHETDDGAFRVTRIPGPDHRLDVHTEAGRWLAWSVELAAAIQRVRARRAVDLIEFPDWGCEAYAHLLNRAEDDRTPVVIHLHGPLVMLAKTIGWPEPESDFFRFAMPMERACLRAADALYSSSRVSAGWCAREYGLDEDAIPVLHTGVDSAHFRPQAAPRDARPTVLFVGRIEENKGVRTLLDAACRLAGEIPDLRLRLVGRGNPRLVDALTETARRRGHPELLEFAGFVPRDALPEALARAHVFAAPSAYEGGPGFVYLEAMACGLPVIACHGSGASEVVTPGRTGEVVAAGDDAALASILRGWLGDPQRAAALGDAARAFVLEHADERRCVDAIARFFERVIARGRR